MTDLKHGDKFYIEVEFDYIDGDGDVRSHYRNEMYEVYPTPDMVILPPPLTSDIVAALKFRTADVEVWDALEGCWIGSELDDEEWNQALEQFGDQPQPGYRISAVVDVEDSGLPAARTWTDAPRLTSDIIDHLENGGAMEQWDPFTQSWGNSFLNLVNWKDILNVYGDRAQPGFRLSGVWAADEIAEVESDDGLRVQVARDKRKHDWRWRIVNDGETFKDSGYTLFKTREEAAEAGKEQLRRDRANEYDWSDV